MFVTHWPAILIYGPDAGAVRELLGECGAGLIERWEPAVVMLEGGATARAVLEHVGWRRFAVEGVLADGVVAIRPTGGQAAGVVFVVKPGSYEWPRELFVG